MPQQKIRQAILLADIYEQEMEILNKDIPTLLLQVGNVPLIEILLHHLYVNQISQLIIIYSKNSYQIKQYIDNTSFCRVSRELTHQECLCGQMCDHNHHQLQQQQKIQVKYIDTHYLTPIQMLTQFLQDSDNDLDNEFLFINGPSIFNFDIQKIFQTHQKRQSQQYLATMIVQKIEEGSFLQNVHAPFLLHYNKNNILLNLQNFVEDEDLLINFIKYGMESYISTEYQPSEIYILNKSIIPLILNAKQQEIHSFFELIQTLLNSSSESQIGIYDIQGFQSGRIDCPRVYKGINNLFINKKFPPYAPEINTFSKNGKRINQQQYGESFVGQQLQLSGQIMGQSFIGNQCKIDGFVTDSIIGDSVKVGFCTEITSSILSDRVTIGKDCFIKNCIILKNTNIQNNVSLSPGSIIGADIFALTNELVLNSIRCFTQTIWGIDQIISLLINKSVAESDVQLFKLFYFGQNMTIPNSVLINLPPVYICKQYATQITLNRYEQACEYYTQVYDTPQNVQYELDLQFIKEEPQRLINEAQIENLYDDDEISNETDVDNLKNNYSSYATTDQDETCGDSQSPSKLAQYINNVNQTDIISKYWIPIQLIRNAQNCQDIELLKANFLKNQLLNGFSFVPEIKLFDNPYNETCGLQQFHVDETFENVDKYVISTKYGLQHYETLPQEFQNQVLLFQCVQEISNWNIIAQMLLKIFNNNFFQQYYLQDMKSSDIFHEVKELCLNFTQNLQFTYITLKHKQDFDLAPTLVQILIVLALQDDCFEQFNSQNQATQNYKLDDNIQTRLYSIVQFLTRDAKRFGAVSPLNAEFDPEDLIVQICLIIHFYIFKSNVLEIKQNSKNEIVEMEQQLSLAILEVFIEYDFLTQEQVLEWANNQLEIYESYEGMEDDELEEEDLTEIELYEYIASYIIKKQFE